MSTPQPPVPDDYLAGPPHHKLLERMDELHPETLDSAFFSKVDGCMSELTETASHIAAEADEEDGYTEIGRGEADQLLGYLIEEIAIHMESYEAAEQAIREAFPETDF